MQDVRCWGPSVVQTYRDGSTSSALHLQNLPFWGDGPGGRRFIPHVSCAMNLPAEKDLYTSESSAVVCASRTALDTVASISVCLPCSFGQVFPGSWPETDHSSSDRKTQP